MTTRCIGVLAIVAALSGHAGAQPAGAQPAGAQAEVLFREGRQLMAKGKLAEACTAFAASQELEPTVPTLMNLANCREKLGQLATAWGLFLDVERQTRSSSDPAAKSFHEVAVDRGGKLEARISKLTINVPPKSQVEGLEILRGTERVPVALWNRAMPIDGGSYTIAAHAPGANRWTTEITIETSGDAKAVDVPPLRKLAADVGAPPGPQPPSPPPRVATSRLPILVGIGGLVLLGGAVGIGVWAHGRYDYAKAETVDQMRRDSLVESANTRLHVAEGVGVAGLGGIAVSLWLWHAHKAADDRQAAVVVPTPTGLAIAGWF